ncbi:hypothetical protein NECID01_1423 [Nematocida sp. AWRm77]|nr:hypothetical protein NECID01_1423 [Nematocida sp. AWRm77]
MKLYSLLKVVGVFILNLGTGLCSIEQIETQCALWRIKDSSTVHLKVFLPYNPSSYCMLIDELNEMFQSKNNLQGVTHAILEVEEREHKSELNNKTMLFYYNRVCLDIVLYVSHSLSRHKIKMDMLVINAFNDTPAKISRQSFEFTELENTFPFRLPPGVCVLSTLYIQNMPDPYMLMFLFNHIKLLPNSRLKFSSIDTLDFLFIVPSPMWSNLVEIECDSVKNLKFKTYFPVIDTPLDPGSPDNQYKIYISPVISTRNILLKNIETLYISESVLKDLTLFYRLYLRNQVKKDKVKLFNSNNLSSFYIFFDQVEENASYLYYLKHFRTKLREALEFIGMLEEADSVIPIFLVFNQIPIALEEIHMSECNISLERFNNSIKVYKNLKILNTEEVIYGIPIPWHVIDIYFIRIPEQTWLSDKLVVDIPQKYLPDITRPEILSSLSKEYPNYPFVRFLQEYKKKSMDSTICTICSQPLDCSRFSTSNSSECPSSFVVLPCAHAQHYNCFFQEFVRLKVKEMRSIPARTVFVSMVHMHQGFEKNYPDNATDRHNYIFSLFFDHEMAKRYEHNRNLDDTILIVPNNSFHNMHQCSICSQRETLLR